MNAPRHLSSQIQAPSTFEFTLLNAFQRHFPLVARPYAALATQLDSDEGSVIASLHHLQQGLLDQPVGDGGYPQFPQPRPRISVSAPGVPVAACSCRFAVAP